jgi:hypothetical protein
LGNLHRYWDVEFVDRLGADPRQVAASLIGQISEKQRQEWSRGKPADWAMEAFALARQEPDRAGCGRRLMSIWRFPRRIFSTCVVLSVVATHPHPASAWGDEGHKIIALIAEHYLDPGARAKMAMLLVADTDTLTGHDIASEATWADKYRDSDRDKTKVRSLPASRLPKGRHKPA